MAKCDICGESCHPEKMSRLSGLYQVDGVRDVCPKCIGWLSRLRRGLIDEVASTVRRAIVAQQLTARQQPAARPRRWWWPFA